VHVEKCFLKIECKKNYIFCPHLEMVNKNPTNPKEFTLPNGDAPSSTIVVVGSSLTNRFNTTILAPKTNQQLTTL